MWKQQLELRPTRALAPAAKAATVTKFFIVVGKRAKIDTFDRLANGTVIDVKREKKRVIKYAEYSYIVRREKSPGTRADTVYL